MRRLTILVTLSLAIFAAHAAEMPKQGADAQTTYLVSTSSKTTKFGDHTVTQSEFSGITRNESGGAMFDKFGVHCVIFSDNGVGHGDCVYTDREGDQIFAVNQSPGSEGIRGTGVNQIVGGTGKYAGISGKREYSARAVRSPDDTVLVITSGIATWKLPENATAQKFHFTVDPTIVKQARAYFEAADKTEHPVAVVKDDKGVTSEFVEDEIVVRDDPAEIDALVSKYHAKILRQIVVNVMSADGKSLGPAKTRPRTVLQLDATNAPVNLDDAVKGGTETKVQGEHVFSSERAARLTAIMVQERTAGHQVYLNFLMRPQDYPTSSIEGGMPPDAFTWPEFDHRAWQYAIDMGIKAHPLVAIIDGGFWLTANGTPCGIAKDAQCATNAQLDGVSDLPASMLEGDATGGPGPAGGMNPASCTNGFSCPWHGNGTASVVLGTMNNKYGAVGTGAPAAVPFLIKTDVSTFAETIAAIEAAVSQGASIINISSGGSCDIWCFLGEQTIGNDIFEPVEARSQGVLVVASAGNDGQDAWGEKFWPCILSFCVGAIDEGPPPPWNPNTNPLNLLWIPKDYSNYGLRVDLWAPTDIHAMPDGSSFPALTTHNGTSASAPYVSGVAALMKAVNPSLTADQLASLLVETGLADSVERPGTTYQVYPEQGPLIDPFAAVVAANGGKPPKPRVKITSPANGATVTEQFTAGQINAFQAVTFTAMASDILAGTWPIPTNSPFATGPIVWTSSVDGPMMNPGDTSGGTSITFPFPTTATPGNRTITATATNKGGASASDSITVNYQPVYSKPMLAITYPPPGATLPAGTVQARGSAQSALGGNLPCSEIVWQKGIAPSPIPSSPVTGAASGVCGAAVPFSASANPQTLAMIATDTTGESGTVTEPLTIAANTGGAGAISVGIDSPTPGAQYTTTSNPGEPYPVAIALHAFAQNVPASVELAYTWSWYQTGASPSTATALGTGQSLTWMDNSACGAVTVRVLATAQEIPASQSPSATQPINITCVIIQ